MTSRARHLLIASVVFPMLGCATTATKSASASADDGAELAAVIDTVRDAIVEAQTSNVPGFPPLKSITVKLQTTVSRSVGGGVRFLVFSLGSSVGADTASTLELDMKPPATRQTDLLIPAASLKQALAQAIHLAKIGVVKASEGTPPLEMKSVSIDLKFAVAVKGSAGANVTLVPIGLEGTGRISREKVHTVSLTFGS